MVQHCSRIESESDVRMFLENLRYALDHGGRITFQRERIVDTMREREYTNAFTVNDLFPDMDPAIALKKELRRLTVGDYIRTVTDIRFPKKSEMREFGRVFKGKRDVYIKIRVELFLRDGCHTVFVMSFHYAERPMDRSLFPYSKKEE